MARQLEELWRYTQQVARQEFNEPEPDFGSLDPEELARTIDRLNQVLRGVEAEDQETKKRPFKS